MKVDAAARSSVDAHPANTVAVQLDLAVRTGHDEAPVSSVAVNVHATILRGIVWALDHGISDVFLGYRLTDNGPDAGTSLGVLALIKVTDGYFIPGDCEDALYRKPLAEGYGPQLTALLDRVVGSTSAETKQLIDLGVSSAAPGAGTTPP